MRKRWIRRGIALTVITGTLGVMLWFAGALPSSPIDAVVAALLVALSCALLWWTREDLPSPSESATWYTVRRDDATVPPAMDYRLVRLRRDLRDAVARSSGRVDAIHPLVTHLAARGLHDRHGIDLATEPDRARAVLTEDLWAYLSEPPGMTERTTRRQLDRAIEGVEKI